MKKTILSIVAMLLMLSACSTDETAVQLSGDRVPITLTAADLQTRASDGIQTAQFDEGTKVIVNLSIGNAAPQDYTFKAKLVNETMTLVPLDEDDNETTLYYPAGESGTAATNVTVNYAYAPVGLAYDSGKAIVQPNQTEDSDYKKSDLIWVGAQTAKAKPTTLTSSPISLAFNHLLTKVRIKVTKGDGVTKVTKIVLKSMKDRYTFTKSSGVSEITGSQDITVTESTSDIADGTTYYTAVIPEQTIDAGTPFLEITTAEGTAVYQLASVKPMDDAHQYTLDVTVNLAAVEATSNTIEGWASEGTVTVNPTSWSYLAIANIPGQTYSGSALTPAVTVTYNGNTLTKDEDYTVQYQNHTNAGTATVFVTGKAGTVYAGSTAFKTFTINPYSLNQSGVSFGSWNVSLPYTYDGTAHEPTPTLVTTSFGELNPGVDFTYDYADNTNAGYAKCYVRGIGNFTDEYYEEFRIDPKPFNSTNIEVIRINDGAIEYPGAGQTVFAYNAIRVRDKTLSRDLVYGTDYMIDGTYMYTGGSGSLQTYNIYLRGINNYFDGSLASSWSVVRAARNLQTSGSTSMNQYGSTQLRITYNSDETETPTATINNSNNSNFTADITDRGQESSTKKYVVITVRNHNGIPSGNTANTTVTLTIPQSAYYQSSSTNYGFDAHK